MQVANPKVLDPNNNTATLPVYSLKELLLSYKKDRLNKLASYYKIPKRSTLKKAELAEAIEQILTDSNLLNNLVQAYTDEERKLFDQLLANSYINDLVGESKDKLKEQGILHEVNLNEQTFVVMPTDLKKAWYQGDFQFDSEECREDIPSLNGHEAKLLVYLKAMRNLFGAYPKQLLLDLYQQHQDTNISLEQLEKFFPIVSDGLELEEKDGYYLSSLLAENNFEGLYILLRSMNGKKYYMPNYEEVLSYQDENYYTVTTSHKQLATELVLTFNINKEEAFGLVEDLDFHFRQGFSLDKSVYYFKNRNIVFNSPAQSVKVRDLTIAINNDCRMWFNGGHTPNELIRKGFKPVKYTYYIQCDSINHQAQSQKVDRNSPCPCGSGKKYKKCCL